MTCTLKVMITLALFSGSMTAVAQRADPAVLKQAADANSLTGEGKTPFYLKMNFQLYRLNGKESETGTIEEWWVSPDVSRLVIVSPSINITNPSEGASPQNGDDRAQYLVNKLVDEILHPLPDLSKYPFPTSQVERAFGDVHLDCFIAAVTDARTVGAPPVSYCVEPKSKALRAKVEQGVSTTLRNSLGIFHQTHLAQDIQLSYGDKRAISGKLEILQVLDASKVDLPMTHPEPVRTNETGAKNGVIAGRVIEHPSPIYPEQARLTHAVGTVLLHARISTLGKIEKLTPIASPNQLLTDAATDAVRRWTYQPYLLNGEPMAVDTSIYVNFNLTR